MGTVEIIVLGLALSMDAFAVTISNTFAFQGQTRTQEARMPLAFGVLQAVMPLIGYVLGSLISTIISSYAGILTFIILGFIGGKMVVDTLRGSEEETQGESTLTWPLLLFQAVATSIDALAVGVSFAALEIDVGFAVILIGITTALSCAVALLIGKRFGTLLGKRATIVGGIVLILIGIKALAS